MFSYIIFVFFDILFELLVGLIQVFEQFQLNLLGLVELFFQLDDFLIRFGQVLFEVLSTVLRVLELHVEVF